MNFFERIFTRGPSRGDIKELIDEVEAHNQFYKSIFADLLPNAALRKDYKIKDYIEDGYEKNADTFALIDRLTTMFAQIPRIVVQGPEDEVIENNGLNDLMQQPNSYQVWEEFAKLWYTFYLTTGNAITYAPKIENGNDRGKLMPGGMFVMPTQHINILAGGWRDPVKHYILDIDQSHNEKIAAEQVIHVRMPNLQFREGANFMGMSPLKVAVLIIEAENQGLQTIADTLAKGMPPGILTKVKEEYDEMHDKIQQAELRRSWREKHGNQKYKRTGGDPVLGWGDIRWIQMGFSNFRDLQILEMNEHGLRVLCNVLGVPSIPFNDPKGSQHWNLRETRQMIYTNRLIPDMKLLCSYINSQLSPAYGDVRIKPDYSEIPELQEDKKELATWLNIAVQAGVITRNEFRKVIGFEQSDEPGMDEFMIPFNMVPISGEEDIEEAKILEERNIDDYKLKAV